MYIRVVAGHNDVAWNLQGREGSYVIKSKISDSTRHINKSTVYSILFFALRHPFTRDVLQPYV